MAMKTTGEDNVLHLTVKVPAEIGHQPEAQGHRPLASRPATTADRAGDQRPVDQPVLARMSGARSFTADEARQVGEQIGIDWATSALRCRSVPREDGRRQRRARAHRRRHERHGRRPACHGKIALAYLNEFPDYYSRLSEWRKRPSATTATAELRANLRKTRARSTGQGRRAWPPPASYLGPRAPTSESPMSSSPSTPPTQRPPVDPRPSIAPTRSALWAVVSLLLGILVAVLGLLRGDDVGGRPRRQGRRQPRRGEGFRQGCDDRHARMPGMAAGNTGPGGLRPPELRRRRTDERRRARGRSQTASSDACPRRLAGRGRRTSTSRLTDITVQIAPGVKYERLGLGRRSAGPGDPRPPRAAGQRSR